MNLNVGGWIPKISNHRSSHGNIHKASGSFNQPLCTLFIENLPEEVDQVWLRKNFNKYGSVKDVFIPAKRSKRTGSKFGFVRYDCHVSAGVAISKSNGLWVQDKQLFVKEATFGYSNSKPALKLPFLLQSDVGTSIQGAKRNLDFNLDADIGKMKSYNQGKSYAQVVTGVNNNLGVTDTNDVVLKISPSGNDWLLRSAVGLLHILISVDDLQKEFYKEHGVKVIIRDMGGRSILITYPNEELRNVSVKEHWLKRCFVSLKSWNGDAASLERLTWINCFGLPLDAWCMNTFKRIGEFWGQLLSVDDDTLFCKSFVKGRLLIVTKESSRIDKWIKIEVDGGLVYDVRILEDNSSFGLSLYDFSPTNLVMHDSGVATESSSIRVDVAVDVNKETSTNEVLVVDTNSFKDLNGVANNINGILNKAVCNEDKLVDETKMLKENKEILQYQEVHPLMESNCCKTAVPGAQAVEDSFDEEDVELVGSNKEKEELSLGANQFTGRIPSEIGNLTMLKELYLGENSLEEVLALGSAGLTGLIPSFLFNISSLQGIDLSENNFSGSLPRNICPQALDTYLIWRNKLSGTIPSEIGNCTALSVIELSENDFTGTTILSMSVLGILHGH
ncbi:hypothetical protein Vadar_031918 [Vaccinium darrowii]|uniref:Uncharacterized protein n=1 Tax=Vaccinium darrowii TaxID=229202 RepID=A0ACB7ZN59_9ERIC|nr:hypothetical protein Vadar_031918 [Vaccinium darrowii]